MSTKKLYSFIISLFLIIIKSQTPACGEYWAGGFYGDAGSPTGAVAPHLKHRSGDPIPTSYLTFSDLQANPVSGYSVSAVNSTFGTSITAIRINGITNSTTAGAVTAGQYIYTTITVANNSPLINLNRIQINRASTSQVNVVGMYLYDVSAGTNNLVGSITLNGTTGAPTSSTNTPTAYLYPGKTYQLRFYVTRNVTGTYSADIDNPAFFAKISPNSTSSTLGICNTDTMAKLLSLVSSPTPSGFTIRVFKGTTDVTTSTTITTGTYTLYYYNTASSCYQTPGSDITVISNCCTVNPNTTGIKEYANVGISTKATPPNTGWPKNVNGAQIAIDSSKPFIISTVSHTTINNPVLGMLIYDPTGVSATQGCFMVYFGGTTGWKCITKCGL